MVVGFAGPIDTRVLADVRGLDTGLMPEAYGLPVNSLLVSALLDAGIEVRVFGLSREIDAPETWDFGSLKVCLGRYRSTGRAKDLFKLERQDLMAAMQQYPCDVLNAHWTYEFALAALRVDRHALISVRDWAPAILKQMPNPYRLVRLLMAIKVFLRGRHFTANSPYIQRVVEQWARKKTHLIPNGLSDVSYDKKGIWKQPGGGQMVTAINRGFFERKNLPALLEAFAMVRAELPETRLQLIGHESEEGSEGHRWAVERSLDLGVDFVGVLPFSEVQTRLGQSSLLMHPSLEESFGMVLIEAMAKGIPVVAGEASGAVPWVLGAGDAGVLVDVTKSQDIADAMIRLLGNEAQWQEYSDNGYEHAYGSFRMSAIAEQYIECYKTLIDEPRKN